MDNEELKKIRENLKKIEEFCKTEIMPKLGERGRVSVDFGRMINHGLWDCKPEHTLTVSYDGIFYRTGGLVLPFEDTNNIHHGNVYKSCTYAKDLILNWQAVKQGLLDDLEQQQAEHNAIMDFKI